MHSPAVDSRGAPRAADTLWAQAERPVPAGRAGSTIRPGDLAGGAASSSRAGRPVRWRPPVGMFRARPAALRAAAFRARLQTVVAPTAGVAGRTAAGIAGGCPAGPRTRPSGARTAVPRAGGPGPAVARARRRDHSRRAGRSPRSSGRQGTECRAAALHPASQGRQPTSEARNTRRCTNGPYPARACPGGAPTGPTRRMHAPEVHQRALPGAWMARRRTDEGVSP